MASHGVPLGVECRLEITLQKWYMRSRWLVRTLCPFPYRLHLSLLDNNRIFCRGTEASFASLIPTAAGEEQ